ICAHRWWRTAIADRCVIGTTMPYDGVFRPAIHLSPCSPSAYPISAPRPTRPALVLPVDAPDN
ncbi:MAG: hypothetical protein ABIP19_12150, partial [Dermatophilaceae bacterium]